MKAFKYIIAAAGLLLSFSCSDFLEYRDKDKVIPQTLDQYSELIYGQLLYKETEDALFTLEYMTDDISSFAKKSSSSYRSDGRLNNYNYYIWAKEPQLTQQGDEIIDKIWEQMYHRILMCNIIEHDIAKIKVSLDEEIAMQKRMLAEVQFTRAMSYYYLVNTYGAVYENAAQAATAMGVPINNETGIYAYTYTRSSLAAVCTKMEEDLDLAIANFKIGEQKNTIFRPNLDVTLLFKSRLYLMMHRYDDVIAVCDELIRTSSKMIAPAEYVRTNDYYGTPFISKKHPGILFSCWKRNGFTVLTSDEGRYNNAQGLIDLYVEDLRLKAFFGTGSAWSSQTDQRYKFNANYSAVPGLSFRIEEAYLNKAEAMLLKQGGNYADALDVANQVRRQRITENGTLLSATSHEEAWQKFKEEKRREFCYEDIRWFDIRRWNERVTHIYQDFNEVNSYVTYVLESGSPNYILSLPQDVVRINDKIEQPQRVEAKMIPNE